ncbi:hypothetical protein LX36DRAFT_175858 [Colletotrichum falcatum]|nr:hypothetical protein LX36DRAFT_175858 [Colletotrichum falcatum]
MLTTHAYTQGSINKHISRYETTAVFTHPDAVADVVLVHGLNGDPEKTWTSSGAKGVFWPADLLPQSLGKTRANILVYGYNADVYTSGKGSKSASDNFISQHAQTLVINLTLYRKSERTSKNPIIFVAHSLGGLLVKRALLYSNDVTDKNQEDFRSIFVSTYGIIFLGTPHTGSDMATWGLVLQRMADAIAPRKVFESESVLLKTLKKDNETLQNINSHFLDVYQRFQIHMAHENHKTDVKGTKMLVVDAKSASPQLPGVTYYGIEATHSGMCKFGSTSAPGYRNVSTAIRDWAEDAQQVIRTRWEIEIDDRKARAQSEAAERTRDYRSRRSISSQDSADAPATQASSSTVVFGGMGHAPSASGRESYTTRPIFVHPGRFRPNSFFKGRQEELRGLHKLLTDAKRRSEGTSAVLIQGIPGAGKTHLARQYVFNHKDDYPGGIYWIRSTTLQDMEDGFWLIAKTEAIKGMAAQEEKKDLLNPQKMVEIVRSWFNESENWLLVFDGIRFSDDAVLDFIPDRPNSSLIYTSTERAEPGAYRLDNPSIMRLGLLPVQDAQELLLEEMGKKQPYTTDDLIRAQDLVQLMGRLPLMIHAAALQMNATREPLAKYLKSFRDTPRVGILPAYKTIRDQLQNRGDTAALNLIYTLSFFSQSMPVEMLALGLKALDKRTPVKTQTARHKKSLNQTFVTLLKFALIERNETDDITSSSSQSSRQSVELIPEPLDTLRVHSIIQAFFVELLAEEGQLEFWLERAVRVFCRSLDEADARMNTDSDTGLPDDYRQYVRHGKKLMEHLDRHAPSHTHRKAREQPNSQRDNPADLVVARIDLEKRLAKLPGVIDALQKAVSTDIVDGNKTATHSSVFERTCSMSSQSTNSSNGATLPNFTYSQDLKFQSPPPFIDPNHFHTPCDSFPEDRELRAEDERSENRTITPCPLDVAEGPDANASGPEWTVVPKHRSVKKLEQRRYHDRGGSWRETTATVNDPRVSISRESAWGHITPPQSSKGESSPPSRSRVTAISKAQIGLMHIKEESPPPPRGGGKIHTRGRSSSTATAQKPLSILGKPSYANVTSGTTVEDETSLNPMFPKPPSRAGSIDRVAAYDDTHSVNSFQSIDSTTLSIAQQMKENQMPDAIGCGGQTRASASPALQQDKQVRPTYLSSIFRRMTGSGSGGKRRGESSKGRTGIGKPGDSADTRPPDPQSTERVPSILGEGTRTANSSRGKQHSAFSLPVLPVVTNQTSSLQRTPMSKQDAATSRPPYPYDDDDGEFYGKALSRSNPDVERPGLNIALSETAVSEGSVQTRPPSGYSSQPMSRYPSSNPQTLAATGSISTPGSSNSGSIGSSLAHPRAPSMVQTEPSPRIPPIETDQTSYGVWTQRHNGHSRDEARAGGSNVSSQLQTSQPPSFIRESPITSPRSASGGESMARSGSGGLLLSTGGFIGFGEIVVDVTESQRRRAQTDHEALQRSSEEAVEFSRQVRAGNVGNPPPELAYVGLGVHPG